MEWKWSFPAGQKIEIAGKKLKWKSEGASRWVEVEGELEHGSVQDINDLQKPFRNKTDKGIDSIDVRVLKIYHRL